MDYKNLLFGPIYAVQGVPVVLTLLAGPSYEFTALDKTAGIDVGDGGVSVPTIKPAAFLRIHELSAQGIAVEDTVDGTLTMNGFAWKVTNYKLKPTPLGENDGEVILILAEKTALDEGTA